ncbi:MAG: hypothetical protein GX055_09500 [Desulfovibrionales bacterium]|nr:hypothetical protein [Desulfovibrionales bacterium]
MKCGYGRIKGVQAGKTGTSARQDSPKQQRKKACSGTPACMHYLREDIPA